MFCSKCGKQIPDIAQFCPYCSAPVEIINDNNNSSSNGIVSKPNNSSETSLNINTNTYDVSYNTGADSTSISKTAKRLIILTIKKI